MVGFSQGIDHGHFIDAEQREAAPTVFHDPFATQMLDIGGFDFLDAFHQIERCRELFIFGTAEDKQGLLILTSEHFFLFRSGNFRRAGSTFNGYQARHPGQVGYIQNQRHPAVTHDGGAGIALAFF